MGHVIAIFGTLVVLNYGVGYMASEHLYDEEAMAKGEVVIEEVQAKTQENE